MKLEIEAAVFDEMVKLSRAALPLEACGLLAGSDGRVTRLYSLTNADASPVHYSMVPEEQFAAMKDIRATGLRLLAIWHSHPDTPARMSQEDLRLAYTPGVAYAIISLADNVPLLLCFEANGNVANEIQTVVLDNEPALERTT